MTDEEQLKDFLKKLHAYNRQATKKKIFVNGLGGWIEVDNINQTFLNKEKVNMTPNTTIEPITSTYKFSDLNDEGKKITISLEINHKIRQFNIEPNNSHAFGFRNSDDNGGTWRTIARLIIDAIDFAQKELCGEKK